MLVACVIIAIAGIATKHYGLLALLPFGIFGSITAFVYGSSGRPSGSLDPLGTGGTITLDYPAWVWIVDVALLAAAVLVIKLTW